MPVCRISDVGCHATRMMSDAVAIAHYELLTVLKLQVEKQRSRGNAE